jgi:cytochrome c biogenesis protein
MDFESDLEIWDPEAAQNPVIKKTIQVNEPLTYKGYTFYQASYRPLPSDQGLTLEIGPRGKESQIYSTVVGSSIKLSDDTTITPLELMTDYAGLGMAVRLRETPPGQDSQTYVVFRSYPDFDRDVRRGKWDIRFRGFDQQFATGVQVGRVPFVEIVFWSAIAMAWGMAMAFFMSHRRYWARWQRQPNGTYTLTMAGAARRHQHQFYMEFKRAQTDVLKNYPLPSGGPYDSTSA